MTPNLIPPFYRAIDKLEASRLSDQREAMGDDVDVSTFNLDVEGRTSLDIRDQITAASISRTIEGASTLNVTVRDDDLTILRSGHLGGDTLLATPHEDTALKTGVDFPVPVYTNLDGLWFQLTAVVMQSRTLQLTFQDREVMLLRSYPKIGDPDTYKVFFESKWDRAAVMVWLINEVKEIKGGIRIVCPLLTGNDRPFTHLDEAIPDVVRKVRHEPGLPTSGPSGVTVKGQPANPQQRKNIQDVLDAGNAKHVPPKLLIVAVMVITQESSATNLLPSTTGVGLFQQNPLYWPATGDPTTDANAFFDRAASENLNHPDLSYNDLAQAVQRSAFPNAYGQWQTEAQATVTAYTGELPGLDDTTGTNPSSFVPGGPVFTAGRGSFTRGSRSLAGNQNLIVRENNWAMLQRLANEVGWACYCVSGTVYIEDQRHLFRKGVAFQFRYGDDGIADISFNINTGLSKAQATVECRIGRWQAPPGHVVAIEDHGSASGRWLVTTVERDLFTTDATITLGKPQTPLPNAQSVSPVLGVGVLEPSGTSKISAAAAAAAPSAANPAVPAGFVIYDQGDPRWANHPIYVDQPGIHNIGTSGCGPTAAAIVIANLKDSSVTPIDTGDYMTLLGSGKGYVNGEGATTQGLVDVLQKYGLTTTLLGSLLEAKQIVARGGLVIVQGAGAPPFSAGGHVVVIRGTTASGNVLIANPAGHIYNPSSGFASLPGTIAMIGATA